MVKGPEDFINGNWRASNGHESGQWSVRTNGQRWPRVAPTFLFLHVDGQLRTPPQLLRCSTIFGVRPVPLFLTAALSRSTIGPRETIRAMYMRSSTVDRRDVRKTVARGTVIGATWFGKIGRIRRSRFGNRLNGMNRDALVPRMCSGGWVRFERLERRILTHFSGQ